METRPLEVKEGPVEGSSEVVVVRDEEFASRSHHDRYRVADQGML
jgi:hypothetical protein